MALHISGVETIVKKVVCYNRYYLSKLFNNCKDFSMNLISS